MRSLVLATVVGACAAGCTFLVSFDDVPSAGEPADEGSPDAGRGRTSSSSSSSSSSSGSSGDTSSSSSSSSSSGTVEKFPPDCDGNVNLGDISCGNYTRAECGSEPGVTGIEANDLVECDAAKQPQCVRHCPNGCAEMPSGFPDQCDDCFGKPNGTYCAKDFRNWDPKNAVFAIRCQDGRKAEHTNCSDTATACATKCTTGTASPSCCQ